MTIHNSYKITHYKKDDELFINDLFNQTFAQDRSLSHWYWKFQNNPGGWYPELLQSAFFQEELIAHFPAQLRECSTSLSTLSGLQVVDICCSAEHRNQGLYIELYKALKNYICGKFDFLYGFPNARSLHIGQTYLNYTVLTEIPHAIVSLERDDVRDLRGEFIIRFVNQFNNEDLLPNKFITDSFETFFSRSPRWLNWRYFEQKDNKVIACVIEHQGSAVGYAVATVPKNSGTPSLLYEFVAEPNSLAATVLWRSLCKALKYQGIKRIACWPIKQAAITDIVSSLPCELTTIPFVVEQIRSNDLLAKALKSPSTWYLSIGDTDW